LNDVLYQTKNNSQICLRILAPYKMVFFTERHHSAFTGAWLYSNHGSKLIGLHAISASVVCVAADTISAIIWSTDNYQCNQERNDNVHAKKR